MFKYKTIISKGKLFIVRLSFYLKDKSSYKLHLILDDDYDEPHSHPWNFKSIILFGGYYEDDKKYSMFKTNTKLYHEKHKIKLFRFLGFKIPTITLGKYSPKIELCSFCKEIGYCKSNKKWTRYGLRYIN